MARDCWLNPKNEDKQPNWFDENKAKRNTEISASVADRNDKRSEELQLVNAHWGKCEEAFNIDDDHDVEADIKTIKNKIKAMQAEKEKIDRKSVV